MTLTEAFWKLQAGLPRQSPGSDPATRSMLRLAGGAQQFKQALDIGCGPGRSSLVLAELGIHVTAVDTADNLLEQLKAAALQKNLSDIDVQHADMQALPFGNESFDLIWAESSIYAMGWEAGLTAWKKLLAKGGTLVATDCAWLTATPSDEAWSFWQQSYPHMLTVPQIRYAAQKAGYEVAHLYVVSDNDWFEEYYTPLLKRHDEFRNDPDPNMQKAITIGRAEIELRDAHRKEYGYVGFVLKKI